MLDSDNAEFVQLTPEQARQLYRNAKALARLCEELLGFEQTVFTREELRHLSENEITAHPEKASADHTRIE